MSKHILIVDDDALLRRSLAFNLQRAGYQVTTTAAAEDALEAIRLQPPDLILLDINLPGMDGLDALKSFQQTITAPIIFLTARRRELDEVLGLELGADDYITKPFDLDVLLARIKANLRRAQRMADERPTGPIEVGNFVIDPAARTVQLENRFLDLSRREFDLLHALALQPGQVIPTDELLTQVWGAEFAGQPQVVYVHIRWLREKVENDPNHPQRIQTVRGVGYKLVL